MILSMKLAKRFNILFLLTLVLGLANVLSIRKFRQLGLFIRYIPVGNLAAIHPRTNISPESLAVLATEFRGTTPEALMAEVMNTVGKIDFFTAADPVAIYRHAQAGGGLVCEGMAKFYHGVLLAHGFEARIVGLKRNLLDIYDTHTTVEVLVDGKWVIFDPTFNVSYQRNGKLLSAQEIKQSFYEGSFAVITPRFYGEVRYPARLENYYMNWLPLFNNVLIWNAPAPYRWAKLPPFRYWWSSRYYYEPLAEHQIVRYKFANQLYFGTIVILPLSLLIVMSTSVLVSLQHLLRLRRPQQNQRVSS